MSEILHIPAMAKELSMTEAALRSAIQRRSKAVPPHIKLGSRVAFKRADFIRWLDKQKPRGHGV
jgi:predicted DNA-binding transcriptional regulator AlpA